jgi:hypothetical protein
LPASAEASSTGRAVLVGVESPPTVKEGEDRDELAAGCVDMGALLSW